MVSIWRRAWRWLAASFAVVVILMALAIGGLRLFLSQTPEYSGEIETWAKQNLDLDLEIGSIDARWGFAGPEISFLNTTIKQDDNLSIRAERGRVAVGVLPLLRGDIVPNRLVLEDSQVEIKRSSSGSISIAGRDLLENSGTGTAAWAETLPSGVFELQNATINYTDLKNDAAYVFKNVSLRFTSEDEVLSLKGTIGLPQPLGDTITFAVDTSDKNRASLPWRLHVQGSNLDLSSWTMLSPWADLGISSGSVDAELSAAFAGDRLELANADFQVTSLTLVEGGENRSYQELSGEFDWDRQAEGWRITARDLTLSTEGRRWEPVGLSFELTTSDDDLTQIIYANADYLNVGDLLPLLRLIPQVGVAPWLDGFQPEGEVSDVLFSASRRGGEWTSYSLRSEFTKFGFRPAESIPGVKNLSGAVRMDSSGGNLQIESNGVVVDLPKTFRWPWQLQSVVGGVSWRHTSNVLTVQAKDFLANNADAKTRTTFRLAIPKNGDMPTLEMRSDVRDALVANAKPYFPKSKIPPKVLAWLDAATVAGRIPEGVVIYDGPIKGFPFDDGQGHFNASFSIEDLTLNYAKGWPMLERANADVVFDNASLDVQVGEGFVADNLMYNSEVVIEDLRRGVVDIRGNSKSPLSNLLDFVQTSPVGRGFGSQLQTMTMEGEGEAQLEIRFPAKEREKTTVKGFVDLNNASVSLSDVNHKLESVTGRLGFSRTALRANKVQASLMGAPVTIDIVPSVADDGVVDATMMVAKGTMGADTVQAITGLPAGLVEGVLPWQCIVRFPREGGPSSEPPNILFESRLKGTALRLPSPFNVDADDSRLLTMDLRFPEPNEIDTEFSFGDNVRMVGNLKKANSGEWSFARANLSFGPDFPALTSTDRIVVSGRLPVFDLDAWLRLGGGGNGGAPLQEVIRSVNLKADQVIAFGQRFEDVGFKLDHNVREWLVQITGPAIEGSIFLPFESGVSRPIIMDMTRLHLARAEEQADDEGAGEAADPREIASLRIKIADFSYGDMKFGGLNARLQQEPNGLRLVNLQTIAPSFETDGSGLWAFGVNGHQSQFDLKLISNNVASTMTDLGYGDTLSADQGELVLNLSWDGPPSQKFLHKLSGTASVGVSKGQLTSVKPKAGRVFGLLSVAALPRRLSLDFRDVFDKGLGFDSIAGDFSFEQGNAYTNNLVLAGPAADVGIVGRTGLVSKDYDQTAVVRAELGNSLPIAGALVGGPGAGAALLVFSQLFKEPLKQMSAIQYRITGSWEEPIIEQIGASGRQGNSG